jgi:hypothetical protein
VRACVTTHLCVCGISMRPRGGGGVCGGFFVCGVEWGAAWRGRACAFLCVLVSEFSIY